MKDRRIQAFNVMLLRRRRIDEELRAALAEQRIAHGELVAQQQAREAELYQRTDELRAYDDRLTAMQESRTPVSITLFNQCQEYRAVVAEQKQTADQAVKQAQKAVQKKEEEMVETRRKILKNDGQIEVYEARIRKLKQTLEQAVEDAQDEEVEESMAARSLRARRAAAADAENGRGHE